MNPQLKPVEKKRIPPTAVDVQNLLAAIRKVEQRHKVRIPHDNRQTEAPDNSPTRNPLRLREVLDALAAFCVSKPKETIAISVEWKQLPEMRIVLFIANNDEVEDETQRHLGDMWRLMQAMASVYRQNLLDSEKDSELEDLSHRFSELCLNFSFDKWKHRLNSKLSALLSISIVDLPDTDPFLAARQHILGLALLYTRENAKIGKPEDRVKWRQFTVYLRETQDAIEAFLQTEPFHGPNSGRFVEFPALEKYLRKVTTPLNQLNALKAATRSPQCRKLFMCPFDIKALSSTAKVATVPNTAKDWEGVFEMAASVHREEYLMDMDVVTEECQHIAREAVRRHVSVHAEVKLAVHAIQTKNESYTYIGVSKLSCRGCQVFLSALNAVHNKRFFTKGSHGKCYYPGLYISWISSKTGGFISKVL
ncbi:hypothetical protein MW887_011958 [Aspergillus wentii]|nr:hypothetical protein MW887_011958 [Aspergillus wentii]